MIQNFKLKNLIGFSLPIIKHPIFSSFFYHIEQFLWCWKNWVEGYKRYLSFRGKRNNVWVFPSQHNYWRIVNGKFCSSQGCKWRYGPKVKYISMIIIVHWLLCWYNSHTQCQLLMYISSWIQYDVHHSWMKKSLYLMDKIINDQIWYNVSIQYNMLYSSINMHANIIQNCSNVICNGGTLKALTQWSRP
jgi:hypothetical protein